MQAQESVAAAELDYINSVFAHIVGKLSLARAIGQAAEWLRLPQHAMTRQAHFGWHSDESAVRASRNRDARGSLLISG